MDEPEIRQSLVHTYMEESAEVWLGEVTCLNTASVKLQTVVYVDLTAPSGETCRAAESRTFKA